MNKFTTSKICRAGIIASVYFVLTYFLQAIAFGPIQARISEALSILPLFFPEAVPALFIGCFLANCFSGFLVFDLTLGTFATLSSAIFTYSIGKWIKNKHLRFIVGVIPPIVINALLVPLVIYLGGGLEVAYWVEVALIGGGQAVSIIPFGGLLYYALAKIKEKNPNSSLFKE